jgi:ribosomal protein L11 methyltransferase
MQPTSWLEICLTVEGEMAEAVAEVLARYAPGGVVVESTEILPDPEGEGHPTGPLRVCAYLPVDEEIEAKRQRLRESLWYLGRIRSVPEPQFRYVYETDWSETWKQHYRPIFIGERLQIVPAWLEPPDPSRVSVRIDPGMAFGTGTHPTTQMCLEAIEDFFPLTIPNLQTQVDVIDIGCGSAILSIAALKLGARRALAVDIDAQALESARKNAALNNVVALLEFGKGSLTDVLEGSYSFKHAPIVIANILAPVIVRMLGEGLGDLLNQDGTLVLSGILDEQGDEVIRAIKENGLHLSRTRQIEDWITFEAQK